MCMHCRSNGLKIDFNYIINIYISILINSNDWFLQSKTTYAFNLIASFLEKEEYP